MKKLLRFQNVPLNHQCGDCRGDGCDLCDGIGYLLTEDGHDLLQLVRMYEADVWAEEIRDLRSRVKKLEGK